MSIDHGHPLHAPYDAAITFDCINAECEADGFYADYFNSNNIGWGITLDHNNKTYKIQSLMLIAYNGIDEDHSTSIETDYQPILGIDEFYPLPNRGAKKFAKSLLVRLLKMKTFA